MIVKTNAVPSASAKASGPPNQLPMAPLTAALYILCVMSLASLGAFILLKGLRERINRGFFLVTISLLGWVVTLFAFRLVLSPGPLLWVGRANFAAVAIVAPAAYVFVRDLAGRHRNWMGWIWAETLALSLATLLLPAVDQAEAVRAGQHITNYGPFFPLYLLHILVFLILAVFTAFRPPKGMNTQTLGQMRVVGLGILATSAIAVVTNAALPFWFNDFSFIHVGPLSTILFLMAVGSAVFAHHLFDVHVVVRATFVYAGIITLALEVYRLSLDFLARLLPLGDAAERGLAATAIALVINAFTQESIHKILERPLCL